MSDPYGRPGQQPGWGPQPPAWGAQPPGPDPQQPAWGAQPPGPDPQQPAWGAQQHPPTQQPAWGAEQPQPVQPPAAQPPAAQQPSWGPPPPAWGPPPPAWGAPGGTPPAPARRSRRGLWWTLGAAVVAALVAVGVVVYLTTRPVHAPTGVQAANGDGGVAISWQPADGAASYEVRRGDDVLGTTTDTSYVDGDAPGGTEQQYAVTTLDEDGDRSDSVEADPVVTPLDPIPALAAADDGADVVLDWETVTGADRYEVSRDGRVLDDAVTESPSATRTCRWATTGTR